MYDRLNTLITELLSHLDTVPCRKSGSKHYLPPVARVINGYLATESIVHLAVEYK